MSADEGQVNPVHEEALVAQKIVHLLPIENMDGSMTYMVIEVDTNGALQINAAEGPRMSQEPPEGIIIDQPTDGQKILQALTAPVFKTKGPAAGKPSAKPHGEQQSEVEESSAERVEVPQADIQPE